jgi:hypothetical protein
MCAKWALSKYTSSEYIGSFATNALSGPMRGDYLTFDNKPHQDWMPRGWLGRPELRRGHRL